MKPRWQHKCDKCILILANHKTRCPGYEGEIHDYYYCNSQQSGRATVIARFGDEGWEYSSGMFPTARGPLAKAVRLAMAQGLIKDRDGQFGTCQATDWEAFERWCDSEGSEGDVDKMCGAPLSWYEYSNQSKHPQSWYCGKCKRAYTAMTKRIRASNKKRLEAIRNEKKESEARSSR
jgi:hypothetical protein